MCAHPTTAKSRRRVTSNGKTWFVTDCAECFRLIYQRKRALRDAFWKLATQVWARG